MMKFLEPLNALLADCWGMLKDLASLVKLEAKLARLSICPLLLTLSLLVMVILSSWLSCLVCIAYTVYILLHSVWGVMFFLLMMHLGLLALLMKQTKYHLKNMSFEKTRQYFSQESVIDEQPEQA